MDLSGDANSPTRTSANALRNRGLITIQRRAGNWEADITDAGRFYLANGHHPDDPRRKTPEAATPKPSARQKATTTATPPISDRRRAAAEELVERLVADKLVELEVETDDQNTHWRRVIDFAKRHRLHPDGTRIEKMRPHQGVLQVQLLVEHT